MSVAPHDLPVPGGRLRVRDEGPRDPSAPVLVLLHGFSFDLGAWDINLPRLARDCRVVRYDLRGFGESDVPTGPYDHGADLDAVIRALGLRRPVLVGLSLGANVALGHAARFDTPLAGLVLAAPGLPGHVWRDMRPPEAALAHARDHSIPETRDFWLRHPLFASLDTNARARAAVHAMVNRYSGWHWKNADPQEPVPPLPTLLDRVRVPVRILSGTGDAEGYREIAAHLGKTLPNATLECFSDVGHVLNIEAPEAFETAVLNLVQETRTSG